MTGVTVLKLVDPIYTILMEFEPLRELLETLYDRYNRTEFIAPDPISVPHRFEGREDREIAGFLSATIAWGNRRAIVGNACRMMSYMDNAPADFVKNASEEELRKLTVCVHRTFNGEDLIAYVRALRSLFRRYGSLGEFFEGRYGVDPVRSLRFSPRVFRRAAPDPFGEAPFVDRQRLGLQAAEYVSALDGAPR